MALSLSALMKAIGQGCFCGWTLGRRAHSKGFWKYILVLQKNASSWNTIAIMIQFLFERLFTSTFAQG